MICARDVHGVERIGKLHTRLSPRASQFATMIVDCGAPQPSLGPRGEKPF